MDNEPEYTDEQFTQSMDDALDFIDANILGQLIEFDYSNPDKNYVAGSATYALLVELVEIMKESGYTIDDIKKVIQDNEDFPSSATIH